MVRIPAGHYVPLYHEHGRSRTVHVSAFTIDVRGVTRAEYLAFVRARPAWQRGAIKPLFAEPAYLHDWPDDLNAGMALDLTRPVTYVSWFAAKAYCAWRGKRLPTMDEWEYVAAASETRRDATRDGTFTRRLVALYTTRTPSSSSVAKTGFRNVYGVADLHRGIWEWVFDFNSIVLSDDSRATAAHDLHLFCASGAISATDPENYAAFLRYGVRAGLTGRTTTATLGFRCAQSI
jgi:formylglycine-generating enzyme required for sulfatase activity